MWDTEQSILAAIPIEQLATTDQEAAILVYDFPYVDGFSPFGAYYTWTEAIANGIPGTHVRRSIYPASPGEHLGWDGTALLREDGDMAMCGKELWLWAWPDTSLSRVTSPAQLF